MEVHLFNTPSALKNRQPLKQFIKQYFKKYRINRTQLNIIFCTDNELLKMNRDYLNHNYFTDILTFDYPKESNTASELYISFDRVKENSAQLSTGFSNELIRVIFHGILHIQGFTDKTGREKSQMRALENKMIDKYKIYVSRGKQPPKTSKAKIVSRGTPHSKIRKPGYL